MAEEGAKCARCGKPLKHELAVKWGIGYDCAGKLGIRKQLLRGEQVSIVGAIERLKLTKSREEQEEELVKTANEATKEKTEGMDVDKEFKEMEAGE